MVAAIAAIVSVKTNVSMVDATVCSSGGGSACSGGGSDELDVAYGAGGQMLVGMDVEPIDERR
jgi:hypothetical protein